MIPDLPFFSPCDDSSEEEIEEPLLRRKSTRPIAGIGAPTIRDEGQIPRVFDQTTIPHTLDTHQTLSRSMEIDDASGFIQLENAVPDMISPTQDTPQTPLTNSKVHTDHVSTLDQSKSMEIDDTSAFIQPENAVPVTISHTQDTPQTPLTNSKVHTDPVSTLDQSKNHSLKRGFYSARQQAQCQTGSQDDDAGVSTPLLPSVHVHDPAHPARDVIFLVEMLTGFYGIMLGYLNWGPTAQSPRQSNTILYWASIVILVYALGAVICALELYKMGDPWVRWASFLSYTIYPVALIGFMLLIILVSLH